MTIVDAQGNHHHGKGAAGGQFASHVRSAPEGGLASIPVDLSNETPLHIDTALSEIFERAWKQGTKVDMTTGWLKSTEQRIKSGRGRYGDEKQVAELSEKIEHQIAEYEAILAEGDPYELEFARRGGWPRAFLVSNGHLHRSMNCSTCNRDGSSTRFNWMPEYSGQDEEQIVEAAGSRVCTVCYPSAPVEVLSRPSQMLTPDEKEAQAAKERRAEERKAREADQAAKALLPGGRELKYDYYSVKTLASARIALTDAIIYSQIASNPKFTEGQVIWRDMLIDAIAAKTETTAEAVRAEAYEKARKKVRRDTGATPKW